MGREGFTLIELMITIALLMVITGIVWASFFSVVTTMEEARLAAEELRFRQFLARSLTTNLTQTAGDWRPGAALREAPRGPLEEEEEEGVVVRFWLQGEDDSGPHGPEDSLTFTSSAPLLGSTALPGFLKQVTIEVERPQGEEGLNFSDEMEEDLESRVLVVTETPVMTEPHDMDREGITELADPDELVALAKEIGFESVGWRAPIRSLDIEYFDGEEWVESWDSLEEGRLPWSVHFRIDFARPDEELDAERRMGLDPGEAPDFELVVSIPVGLGTKQEPPFYRREEEAASNRRGREGGAGGFGALRAPAPARGRKT